MSSPSPRLLLTLQTLGENPDTWGTILNNSVFRPLEDAIAGAAAVVLTTASYSLDDTAGGPTAADGARNMVIVATGTTPGGTATITIPNRSKLYLVYNNTSDASTIDIATATPSSTATVANGAAYWVYCDGSNNVIAVSVDSANIATTAATATNASQLTGVAGANFAQKGVAQTFTKGQVVQRQAVVLTGTPTPNTLQIDTTSSNAFYHLTTGAFNLAAPTGATNGQQFSLIVEQGAGAPHAMTFQASTYMFQGGVAPSLSTAAGQIDYLAFEYVTGLSALGGARWVGSIIKDVGTV